MTRHKFILLITILILSGPIVPCLAQGKNQSQKDLLIEKTLDAFTPPNIYQETVSDNESSISRSNSQELSSTSVSPDQADADVNADGSPAVKNTDDIPNDETIDMLELKDVDISDVLKLLSQKSGLNIIANQNVQGKVTVFLKDVKLKDALGIVLDSNNLAYKVEEGIIRVMPAREFEDRYGYKFGGNVKNLAVHLNYANVNDVTAILMQIKSFSGKILADIKSNTLVLIDSSEKLNIMENLIKKIDVPVQTEVFELLYAQAKTVSEKLAETLNKDTGKVRFDERTNKIVVTDTPSKIKEISKLIKAFDVKETQVLIEAKIIQVTLDKQNQFGIDWEGLIKKHSNIDFKSNFKVIPDTAPNSGSLRIGTVSDNQYGILLQALQTSTHSTILSSPSITALNNHEAKILVGTTQPYVTSTTTTPSSGPATTAESINFIDIGVKLYVTPTIHQDNFITMKIRPEVSSAGTSLTTSNGNKIPIVDTSQAETNVSVKDGVTIIIGGLIKDQLIKSSNRVPVLGNIPLLGAAFRNSDDHPIKSEIIIFLTPKIVTGDVPVEVKTRQYPDNDKKSN